MSRLGPQARASPGEGREGAIVHEKLILVHPCADAPFGSALLPVRHDCPRLVHLVHGKNLVNWSVSLEIPRPEMSELVVCRLDVVGGPALAFVLGKTARALAVGRFHLSHEVAILRRQNRSFGRPAW